MDDAHTIAEPRQESRREIAHGKEATQMTLERKPIREIGRASTMVRAEHRPTEDAPDGKARVRHNRAVLMRVNDTSVGDLQQEALRDRVHLALTPETPRGQDP